MYKIMYKFSLYYKQEEKHPECLREIVTDTQTDEKLFSRAIVFCLDLKGLFSVSTFGKHVTH